MNLSEIAAIVPYLFVATIIFAIYYSILSSPLELNSVEYGSVFDAIDAYSDIFLFSFFMKLLLGLVPFAVVLVIFWNTVKAVSTPTVRYQQ